MLYDRIIALNSALDCIIVADDLTGACDAAVRFHPAIVGLSTHVPTAGTLSISTETRHSDAATIRARIGEAAARLPFQRAHILFKKIDSLLRGNPALDIAAAMQVFACERAIVTPSFPALNRALDAASVRERLGLAGDPRVLCVDAVSDADLDRIVAENMPLSGRTLWVGSGGLAAALARTLPPVNLPAPSYRCGTVIFCIGSTHEATLPQIVALLDCRPGAMMVPADTGAVERIACANAAALLLSGGETASQVCRAAGVEYIELHKEILPGIPFGTLHGGRLDGMCVVTKSGGFGAADALVQIGDFFRCP